MQKSKAMIRLMPILIKPNLKGEYWYITSYNQTELRCFADYVIYLNDIQYITDAYKMHNRPIGGHRDMCLDKGVTCRIIIDAVKINTTGSRWRCYQWQWH